MAAPKRRAEGGPGAADRILATASALFYERGIRATGVNTIAEQSGVTKVTLYAHFGSKDGLVVAHLRARNQRWWAEFDGHLAGCATAEERLRAMFEAYRSWVLAGDFRGCGFVNASIELTAPEHPGHAIISDHKEGIRCCLEGIATDAGCRHPAKAAEEWRLLLEGATAIASLRHSTEPFDHARQAALRLLPTAHPGLDGGPERS
ncbi:TetR/AcrR family transcriptional regulator [Streptomonospora wellingtoniae]|uniref:Helix-turn-helix domain-containing protein n=1 Tax=Streptomonospora wellingtoniae TaxID=3075544 RepID=A0ABU2KMY3_9ACTN|nr:helix-turn-helix domain-containing protein [Streptomonospora sp. DSM 45055]MDT0300625.1 helix-turn-helix domain-containing protein [Streptomonospora sp. DSM 45055]